MNILNKSSKACAKFFGVIVALLVLPLFTACDETLSLGFLANGSGVGVNASLGRTSASFMVGANGTQTTTATYRGQNYNLSASTNSAGNDFNISVTVTDIGGFVGGVADFVSDLFGGGSS